MRMQGGPAVEWGDSELLHDVESENYANACAQALNNACCSLGAAREENHRDVTLLTAVVVFYV